MYTYGEAVPVRLERRNVNCADLMAGFNCGDPVFNEWLYDNAGDADYVSYCFVDANTNDVICYASLACSCITDEKGCSVPAVEIKAFAVDEKYQHMPYSEDYDKRLTLSLFLLMYLMREIEKIATNYIGARYIAIYSVPTAVNFYKRAFFEEVPENVEIAHTKDAEGCKALYKYIEN